MPMPCHSDLPTLTVRQNSVASTRGTPAILIDCMRVSKRPELLLCLRGLLTAGCFPHTCWPVCAKQARLPGSRHGGIYGVWECQADRLYETVAWETSRRIRQAAEWLFRPTHGVWGQGCVGGGGGSDTAAPLRYLFMLPTGDRGQDLPMVSKPKPRVGQSNPKSQGTLEERALGEGTLPHFSSHL